MANILFIIGNGFDISLGLKTSYSEFYKYYKALPTDNKAIKTLRDSIEVLSGNWSDFEKAFGEYTMNLKTQSEYDIVYQDVIDELNKFISNEEDSFTSKEYAYPKKILSDLTNPYAYLREVRQFSNVSSNKTTSIVSFNYTSTFEKLVNGTTRIADSNRIVRIEHIHNQLKDGLIFGVNDVSQIANEKFRSDSTISGELIKPEFNKRLGHTADDIFKELIEGADIICIFGSSLGDTDKLWWESIGERLHKSTCRLIIFHWDGKKHLPTETRLAVREEQRIKDKFIKVALGDNLLAPSIDRIKEQVFIGYNTEMFKNISQEAPDKNKILAIK